jgi:hypothetical protein
VLFLISISIVPFAENQLSCLNSILDSRCCRQVPACWNQVKETEVGAMSHRRMAVQEAVVKSPQCGLFFSAAGFGGS